MVRATTQMRALVVGMGDTKRHDLGLGPQVVRRLAGRLPGEVTLVPEWRPKPLAGLRGAELIVVVAASITGARPGRIHTTVIERPPAVPQPRGAVLSPDLLSLLLGEGGPQRVVLLTVEAKNVLSGVGFSEPVAVALDSVVGMVIHEVTRPRGRVSRALQPPTAAGGIPDPPQAESVWERASPGRDGGSSFKTGVAG